MNKRKVLLDNFIVYGLGGIIAKIIPFIMLPIITRIFPNSSYYGINDVSNTIINLASYLAIFGMYDAMYRIYFENDEYEYRKSVCSTALLFVLCTSILIFVFMIINRTKLSNYFFSSEDYRNIIIISGISFFLYTISTIISAPTRMQNQKKVFVTINIISSIISYSISIFLLKKELYTIALPMGTLISYLLSDIYFYIRNKEWFSISSCNKKIFIEMIKLAAPSVPVFIAYWVFESESKLMVIKYLGLQYEGLYAVGAKFSSVSKIIYAAFSGGWQYFAYSTMKEKDQVGTNSKIFEYLLLLTCVSTIMLSNFSPLIYSILFTKEYYIAYIVSPYLYIAPLLQMLFQIESNQLIIKKEVIPSTIVLIISSLICVLMCIVFIPVLNIEGAALSVFLGYIIACIWLLILLIKMKLFTISRKIVLSFILFVIYMLFWRLMLIKNIIVSTVFMIIIIFLYFKMYKKEIVSVIKLDKEK